MASTKEYLIYILDLLREVNGITYKKMMGEYILYKDGIIFGGIYDDRFLIKKTKSQIESNFIEQIPYPGGSAMYLVDIENPAEIKGLVEDIILDLKTK